MASPEVEKIAHKLESMEGPLRELGATDLADLVFNAAEMLRKLDEARKPNETR